MIRRPQNYYAVLGVRPDASAAGIRTAYRDLAMRYHPDRAGAGSTARFQEIAEAYGVIGDRDRRKAYDAELARRAPRAARRPAAARAGAPVEPLDREPGGPAFSRGSYARHDPLAELLARARRTPSCTAGLITITLSPREAAHGGALELPLPQPIVIRIPPGVRDGATVSLVLPGRFGAELAVVIRVAPP